MPPFQNQDNFNDEGDREALDEDNPRSSLGENRHPHRQGAEIDWKAIRRTIVEGLDVVAEYKQLGVEFTKPAAGPNNWIECRAFGREDRNPSAGVNIATGYYKSFGENAECLSLFDFAVKHGRMGTFSEVLRHYASKAGISLPIERRDEERPVPEETYSYRDEAGAIAYESIRYRKPDGGKTFRQRRPDGSGYAWDLNGIKPVPYNLPELLLADPTVTVWIVEGEKDVERAIDEGMIATCNHGGTGNTKLWAEFAPHLRGRDVIVMPDNDEPGRKHAEGVADRLLGLAASVRVLHLPGVPTKGDLSDFFDMGGSLDELKDRARMTPLHQSKSSPGVEVVPPEESLPGFLGNPPEPQPIRDELLPVAPLYIEMIPVPIRDWIVDNATRMHSPIEYTAVAALVVIASLVGARIGLRPKRRDDWTVVGNLWGGILGRPGAMKSPALKEAMKPLRKIEAKAKEAREREGQLFEQKALLIEAKSNHAKQALKIAQKNGDPDETLMALAIQAAEFEGLKQPPERRYILNDPTIEKLGEVLMDNPIGVLLFRDELMGWFRALEKSGHEQDRAFYLEGFNGNSPFTFDRIARGTQHIPNVCLSILGGIQPGPLASYFKDAFGGKSEDDGLLSRFQLLVYPDDPGTWVNVDEWPDRAAKERAYAIFERLDDLDPTQIGAEFDDFSGQPYLRFAADAQEFFDGWRGDLENIKLRSPDADPQFVSHLAKYRSLMPKLALLFHLIELVDGSAEGPVSLESAQLAAAWCDLLESHARRIYDGFGDPAATAARKLAERVRKGEVASPFAVHDIVQKSWSGLTETKTVWLAIERLESLGWVYREVIPGFETKGRPRTKVHINPRVRGNRG